MHRATPPFIWLLTLLALSMSSLTAQVANPQPILPVPAQPKPAQTPQTASIPKVPAPVEIPVPPSADQETGMSESTYSAIVRVENEAWNPNYKTPWNAGSPGSGVGTGFLVGPNKFLTNAHVVSNSRLLYIKKIDDPKPYEARILHIAHDCDLALLELVDPSAFANVRPLQIGGIPSLNSTVIAVGYPIGGQRISVTRGVVSRVDFIAYAHSGVDYHLAIQVDAAINPGNSGGPVLQNGKVVGVAFQGYSGSVAQSTGYMIPVPVITRFLKDVEDGEYDYYPDLAMSKFDLLNPAQRKALNLPNDGIGVMVSSADSAGSAGGLLETGDIIIAIDGNEVASDGFVSMSGGRVNMNEIVERKYVGDRVKMTILRDGEKKEVDIELKRFLPYLIQANQYEKDVQYVMFAGLVFQPVDRNLLAAHKITNLHVRYLYNYFSQEEIYKERPQIIVITDILPDDINAHFGSFKHRVVDEINGVTIRTMKDVQKALFEDEVKGDFHVIRLHGEGRPVVVDKSQVEEAQQRIMAEYKVQNPWRLGESIMGD